MARIGNTLSEPTEEPIGTIEIVPAILFEFVPPHDIPARAELGSSVRLGINVKNRTNRTMYAYVEVKFVHSSGEPVYSGKSRYSQTYREHEFGSEETLNIPVSVTIPIDAVTGSYTVTATVFASETRHRP